MTDLITLTDTNFITIIAIVFIVGFAVGAGWLASWTSRNAANKQIAATKAALNIKVGE